MIRRLAAAFALVCFLLVAASAESFRWLDYTAMQEEFQFLELSLYRSQTEDNYRMDIYADEQFTRAAIILLDSNEVFSVSYADGNGRNEEFLKQMSAKAIDPNKPEIRILFELWLELQLGDLQDGDIKSGDLGDYFFTVEKNGTIRYVTVSALDHIDKVSVQNDQASTAKSTEAISQEETCTPGPVNMPTSVPEPTVTVMLKPGIAGSNAYDLTIGAEDNGLTVGERKAASDGYSWLITGSSPYGSYTISIETNQLYEIHRAVFSHTGTDTTFFPWAVTFPFDEADSENVTAWVKACQRASHADTITTGDAVWTYKPHDNGQYGGILTVTVDTFEDYSLYLLDQLD